MPRTAPPGRASKPGSSPSARRRQARWQREQRWQYVILVLGALGIAVVLALTGLGIYSVRIAPGRQAVVRVNKKIYTMNDLVRHLRNLTSNDIPAEQIARSLPDILINDEMVRQGATRLNLAPTSQEIQAELRSRVLLARPEAEGDETKMEQGYKELLSNSGLTEAEYREMLAGFLMHRRLREHLWSQANPVVPHAHLKAIAVKPEDLERVEARLQAGESLEALATEFSLDPAAKEKGGDMGWVPQGGISRRALEQARLRLISLDTEEAARAARARLEAGEDFSALSRELSKDAPTRDRGGDWGWQPVALLMPEMTSPLAQLQLREVSQPILVAGTYFLAQVTGRAPKGQIFGDIAFQLPLGEMSPPLLGEDSLYYFLEVVEREERPAAEPYLEVLKDNELGRWLSEQRQSEENRVENLMDEAKMSWALARVK